MQISTFFPTCYFCVGVFLNFTTYEDQNHLICMSKLKNFEFLKKWHHERNFYSIRSNTNFFAPTNMLLFGRSLAELLYGHGYCSLLNFETLTNIFFIFFFAIVKAEVKAEVKFYLLFQLDKTTASWIKFQSVIFVSLKKRRTLFLVRENPIPACRK